MLKELNITQKEEEVKDFKKLHNEVFVDVTTDLKQQPIALSYGTSFGEYTPVVSYGNFMCIVGASKSMKTFLKSAFLAGYIGGNAQSFFSQLRGHDITNKYIIDFDTEQSDYHVQKAARRVVKMVGANYPFYKPFALRSLTPKERVDFVEWIFFDSEYKNKIGLASIDGIADLVDNVNDLDKSNEVVQKLMKITELTKSAMITVLHKNYESDKPTGHLGSAVLKKSETVLFVNKQNDFVEVKSRYSRNAPIEEFSFSLNENVLPVELESNTIF